MSHREDLLAGAVACLREKGYAHTTARDIVAASGTNLASIGYHYGSTKALLNAAVLKALDEFGEQMASAMGPGPQAGETMAERLERFWSRVIDSFRTSRPVWLATFDIFAVAQRDPDLRVAVADGIEDARAFWAHTLYGVDPADQARARAVGSMHQALVSGVLVQWLVDPDRAPSPAVLAVASTAIAAGLNAAGALPGRPAGTTPLAVRPRCCDIVPRESPSGTPPSWTERGAASHYRMVTDAGEPNRVPRRARIPVSGQCSRPPRYHRLLSRPAAALVLSATATGRKTQHGIERADGVPVLYPARRANA